LVLTSSALFSASRKDFTFWNENDAAEYEAIRAIRRIAFLKQKSIAQ
jgi:hypothetical protein